MQKFISLTTVLILLATLMTACSSKKINAAETAANTTITETTAPQATAPETAAAETALETSAPETTAPETTIAETPAPETKAAETAAPSASAQPAPSASGNIDEQAARQIALAAAGVSADQAVFSKTHLDYDDGRQEWEIEFVAGDNLYEYDINAADGTVTKNSVKAIRSAAGASSTVSQDQAKEISLGVFGVTAEQATFTKIKLDNDDGLQVWEIEYVAGNSEYEVEINANDGKVLESSSEILDID